MMNKFLISKENGCFSTASSVEPYMVRKSLWKTGTTPVESVRSVWINSWRDFRIEGNMYTTKADIAKKQYEIVMETFRKGKLRDSRGNTVPKDRPDIAEAIARSEAKAAAERGVETRTWRGRTRTRPKKAN
jgi:hypothetical protein